MKNESKTNFIEYAQDIDKLSEEEKYKELIYSNDSLNNDL
jgi:hypothetical protein